MPATTTRKAAATARPRIRLYTPPPEAPTGYRSGLFYHNKFPLRLDVYSRDAWRALPDDVRQDLARNAIVL